MRPYNACFSFLLAALMCWQVGGVLHAATTILPGPDQLAPGTANQDTSSPRFLLRDSALGDLGGLRSKLRDRGITLTPTYIGEVMGNPVGGITRGVTYGGLLNTALDIDLERLGGGLLRGLTLHTNALFIHGQGLSTRKVGDFSNVSNIAGYNTVRLQELWLQQALWNGRATLRLGVLAADAEFFATSNGSLFLNGTFGAFTLVGSNLPNPPIYPEAAPGVRVAVQPATFLLFEAGTFGGDSGGSQDRNNHGTNLDLRSRDGLLGFAEVSYLVNQSPGDRGLQAIYKLGGFIHTGSARFPTFRSQASAASDAGSIRRRGTNYGLYAVVDQDIYKGGGHAISGFLRAGGAPEDVNFVDFYIDGGLNFVGFVPGRRNDVAGVGVARSPISEEYSRSQERLGKVGSSAETVIEATYKAQIAPWWSVQPDVQYIFNPGGAHGSRDALVLGVRSSVVF